MSDSKSFMRIKLKTAMAKMYETTSLSYQKVADIFETSKSVVWDAVQQLRSGCISGTDGRGGKRASCTKLKSVHQHQIRQWISSNNGKDMYLTEIKEKLQEEYGLSVHKTTIGKLLKRMGISRKKISTRPREKEFTQEKRDRYERYKKSVETDPCLSADRVICVDETGVNDITSQRSHGWAKKGQPCIVKRRYVKGLNRSLLAAISVDGYVLHHRKKGGYKTADFNAFMIELMNKLEERGDRTSYSFVMDNASIHKNTGLKQTVENRGHKIVWIPPYSPEFNPIEEAFSAFKASLRRKYHLAEQCTFDAMDDCIKESITAEKCNSWFKHSGYKHIPNATNGNAIRHRRTRGVIQRTQDPNFEWG